MNDSVIVDNGFADQLIDTANEVKSFVARNGKLRDDDIDILLNAYALLRVCAGEEIGRQLLPLARALAKKSGPKSRPVTLKALAPSFTKGGASGRPRRHTDKDRAGLVAAIDQEKATLAAAATGTDTAKVTDRAAIDSLERRFYPGNNQYRRLQRVIAMAKTLSRYRKELKRSK